MHPGMLLVVCPKHRRGFIHPVRLPDIVHMQDSQKRTVETAQAQTGTRLELLGHFLCHVQSDRHGPECPVGQPHVL